MNNQIEKSRQLRKNMTLQERKLWDIIKDRQFFGYRFRRQFPIGQYIVDFICREKKIILEIDGGQHNEDINIYYDNKRSEYLMAEGYKVIRFWNNDIDNNIDGVYEKLKEVFGIGENITPPQPSPSREGDQLSKFPMPLTPSSYKEGEKLKPTNIKIDKKQVPSPDGEG